MRQLTFIKESFSGVRISGLGWQCRDKERVCGICKKPLLVNSLAGLGGKSLCSASKWGRIRVVESTIEESEFSRGSVSRASIIQKENKAYSTVGLVLRLLHSSGHQSPGSHFEEDRSGVPSLRVWVKLYSIFWGNVVFEHSGRHLKNIINHHYLLLVCVLV